MGFVAHVFICQLDSIISNVVKSTVAMCSTNAPSASVFEVFSNNLVLNLLAHLVHAHVNAAKAMRF